jgi:magnesium-protoporphyrin O-methyltransferase
MSCCENSTYEAAEHHFTPKMAATDMARFREKGPDATTRLLEEALAQCMPLRGRLLDVGAGVGALTFGLLERGVSSAIAVDASTAHLAAAAEEARERQQSEAIRFVHADFVMIESQLPLADIVTLDRVVCCYPSFAPLLKASVKHAQTCIGLTYPRPEWYVKAGVAFENGGRRLRSNPFRTFVHPVAHMREVITTAGFDLACRTKTWAWCVDVYRRH